LPICDKIPNASAMQFIFLIIGPLAFYYNPFSHPIKLADFVFEMRALFSNETEAIHKYY